MFGRHAGTTSWLTRPLAVFMFACFAVASAARGQYVLEDAHDPHRYEPGVTALPFAFYGDPYRLAGGVAGDASGLFQPQTDFFGIALGSSNSSYGILGGMENLQLKPIDRLFLDWELAYFRYTEYEGYFLGAPGFPNQVPGSNDSTLSNFVDTTLNDAWGHVTLKYLLPIGGGRETIINHYVLEGGIPVSGFTGGNGWNPLLTGRTFAELTPFYEYQDVRNADLPRRHFDTNGVRLGVTYDNADFPLNPTSGNVSRFTLSRDFGIFRSSNPWTTLEGEFSQYVPLGRSRFFRQQVLALDGWTSFSPTWHQGGNPNRPDVTTAPPYYEGATLGGPQRLRGFPENRFHDRAAVYGAAELRLIPEWNPLGKIPILKPADITWMQFVIFAEGGRVADGYSYDKLFHEMKADVGVGMRVLSKDTLFRVDLAFSSEGYSIWVNLGQPF
ncbi:MAG: hypothetical protein JWM97_1254 [Phycisphaerales bacterium]|nr:hypothetical protein [Phycisphaerales bacterium]